MPHRNLSSRRKAIGEMNAIEFLNDDNRKTRHFFRTIKKMTDEDQQQDKLTLVKQVCNDLLIHMAIEEIIFYPALREHIHQDALLNEALVEHDCMKELIHDLDNQKNTHPMFDAKVNVLSDYIEHHVREKENVLFPKAIDSRADLVTLGRMLAVASHQLQVEDKLAPEASETC